MSATAELSRSDFADAAELLTEAFFDNPPHVYIVPDEGTRRARLSWLFVRNLRLQTRFGRSFCVRAEPRAQSAGGPGRVNAMGFWHPPGSPPISTTAMLRHGLGFAPLRLGVAATRRLLEVVDAVEVQRQAAQRGVPAWYLNNMVVRAGLRGSGVGGGLLRQQLRYVIDPSGSPAVLTTQRPENVSFYVRLGFEVVSESTVGAGPHAFSNWVMIRPIPA